MSMYLCSSMVNSDEDEHVDAMDNLQYLRTSTVQMLARKSCLKNSISKIPKMVSEMENTKNTIKYFSVFFSILKTAL